MNKAIKTVLCVVIAVCMLCFAACSGKENEQGGNGEINMADFPFYADADSASYDNYIFSADGDGVKEISQQVYRPHWYGNVIYNETVLLVKDEDTGKISGKLLYPANRVLSVKNHDYTITYAQGEDYTVSGNEIIRAPQSAIGYRTQEQLRGDLIPEPYRLVSTISKVETDIVQMGGTIYTESDFLYGCQVSVSYVYDVRDIKESYTQFSDSVAPKFVSKLKNKQEANLTIIGDSVAEGCSSSGNFNHTPFLPNYITLVTSALEKQYDTKVNLFNKAVGGKTSAWGQGDEQVNAVAETNPDIVFIHFGINDCGAGTSQNQFYDNMQSLANKLKAKCPDVEIVFLKCFTPHPMTYDADLLQKYSNKTDVICSENEDFYSLDLYELSTQMLKVKNYMDVTGNGINHINDYTTRLYTMSILSALIDYKNI